MSRADPGLLVLVAAVLSRQGRIGLPRGSRARSPSTGPVTYPCSANPYQHRRQASAPQSIASVQYCARYSTTLPGKPASRGPILGHCRLSGKAGTKTSRIATFPFTVVPAPKRYRGFLQPLPTPPPLRVVPPRVTLAGSPPPGASPLRPGASRQTPSACGPVFRRAARHGSPFRISLM